MKWQILNKGKIKVFPDKQTGKALLLEGQKGKNINEVLWVKGKLSYVETWKFNRNKKTMGCVNMYLLCGHIC